MNGEYEEHEEYEQVENTYPENRNSEYEDPAAEGTTGELRSDGSEPYVMQYGSADSVNYYDHHSASYAGQEPKKEKKRRKKTKVKKAKKDTFGRKAGRMVAAGLIFGLTAGVAFQGVNYGVAYFKGDEGKAEQEKEEPANPDSVSTQQLANIDDSSTQTLVYDVSDIAEKVKPSIVSITTTVLTQYQFFYQEYEQYQNGAGSGIIIGKTDDVLYIATNYHVVNGADEINVGFVDGEVVKATVKGYDEDMDIAVCEVKFSDMKDSTAKAVTIAEIGDSDKLTVGEPAIAFGNALGYGQSVTVGYISALNRMIQDSEGTYIQTDAAINPGNSGGALIDINGRVIGINSIKYVDSKVEGMGFAIPINEAMDIINDIISGNNGTVYMGITGADISKEYSQIYGFPEGIYVKEIETGSPAEAAGLHAGDIIVEFDGKTVYTMEELSTMVKEKEEGDKVRVTVYRTDSMGAYQQMKFELTLAKRTE